MQLKDIKTATSSISYSYASGTFDASYDIWLNPTPVTTGINQQEIMIWLNNQGSIQPFGTEQGQATINGVHWTVWQGSSGSSNCISYVAPAAIDSWNFDILPFFDDAKSRSAVNDTWYLTSIQAGFEPWNGGVGLGVNSFTATITPK